MTGTLPDSGVQLKAGQTLTVIGEVTDDQVNAITAATGAKLVLKSVNSSNTTYKTAGTYTYNGTTWAK